MAPRWSDDELGQVDAAHELEIAARRADGSLRPWVPIWVVRAGEQVYVRTWHHRDTGWFGAARRSGLARIRVPGLETDVTVEDLGDSSPRITADVDAAYHGKYGPGATSMVTAEAVTTTLRISRA